MRRLSLGAALLLAIAGTFAVYRLSSHTPSHASSSVHSAACPKHIYASATAQPDRTIESVLRAARHQIPIAYRNAWTNQSGIVKLSRSTYNIKAVIRAGANPVYFHKITRMCGRATATVTWAVRFYVPAAQSAMYANATAFLAPTGPRTWRLWYRAR